MTSTDISLVTQLLEPSTGEVLPATIENAGRVINACRTMKRQLDDLVAEATRYLADQAAIQGTKTLRDGGTEATLTGGPSIDYDAQDLVEALRVAGCPEDRIDQAVKATITYKVDRSVLRQLAGANPDYAAAIELAKRETDKPWRVTIK